MRRGIGLALKLLGPAPQNVAQISVEGGGSRSAALGQLLQKSWHQQQCCWWAARPWLSCNSRSFAAGPKAAKAARKGAAAVTDNQQAGSFSRWWKAFQSVPTVPKVLGLAGAIPFIALAPPVAKHLTGVLPIDIADNPAMWQVCYGVTIVTFLGAVHWGVAMSSSLAGPVAQRIANEAFIYSVIPSLLAWPVALMEPGAGSIILSILLPMCYLVDYSRRNLGLPQWYMALRVPLTALATFGMLLTATRHYYLEMDRAQQIAAKQAAAVTAKREV